MGRSEPLSRGERRIGLFGGTFDPIHLGHLRCAQEVVEAFRLSQLIFILAANPPHKTDRSIIATKHRWEMVNVAIAENPRFAVSDVEIRREGRSYSIETIAYYHQSIAEEARLFFIVGADAFCDIETWKDYPRLFTLCDFVVISRPQFDATSSTVLRSEGFQRHGARDRFIHPSGHSLYLYEVTPIGISSTEIRRAIAENRSITYLVPREVEVYINKKNLYRA